MRSFLRRMLVLLWSAVLGFVIIVFGAGISAALVASNLASSPAVPWAVPAMALILWAMWSYLGGKWWPHGTSETRRHLLRATQVPRPVFASALLACLLAVTALA
jgi:hypothetical protein